MSTTRQNRYRKLLKSCVSKTQKAVTRAIALVTEDSCLYDGLNPKNAKKAGILDLQGMRELHQRYEKAYLDFQRKQRERRTK